MTRRLNGFFIPSLPSQSRLIAEANVCDGGQHVQVTQKNRVDS